MSAPSDRRGGADGLARPLRLDVIALVGLVFGSLACAHHTSVAVSSVSAAVARQSQASQIPAQGSPRRTGQEQSGTATLRGRVTSKDTGRPLQGAEVSIIGAFGHGDITEPARLKSTTDADGRFAFERLRDGRYGVDVTSTGYVTTSFGQTIWSDATTTFEVPDGQDVTLNFALSQGGALEGRLVDAARDPMTGARVVAIGVGPDRHRRSRSTPGRSLPTNDIGEFRIAELLPGDYYVVATFNQAQPLSRQGLRYLSSFYPGTPNVAGAKKVTVVAGRTHRGINMTVPRIRGARISGTVLNSRGQPLKGFLQITARDSLQAEWTSVGPNQIESDGSFAVGGIAPGEYTVSVAESSPVANREYVSVNMTVAAPDIIGLHIVSQQGPTIAGRVTLPTSGPGALQPRALTVSIQPIEGRRAGAISSWVTLDNDWSFHLPASPGPVRILLSGLPASWRVKTVRDRGTDMTDSGFEAHLGTDMSAIEIQLVDHQSSVSGVVVDKLGNPVKDASAVLLPRGRDKSAGVGNVRFFTTDKGGRFTFGGLPPAEYLVAASTAIRPYIAVDPEFLSIVESRAQRFSLGAGEAKTLTGPLTTLEDSSRRSPGAWRLFMHLFDWTGHTQSARTSVWAPTPGAR